MVDGLFKSDLWLRRKCPSRCRWSAKFGKNIWKTFKMFMKRRRCHHAKFPLDTEAELQAVYDACQKAALASLFLTSGNGGADGKVG